MSKSIIKTIACLFIVSILSVYCNKSKGEKFYIEEFISKKSDFDSSRDYLLKQYAKSSNYKNKVRLIFINPNKIEKTFREERVDLQLVRLMDKLNVSSIHIENEYSVCGGRYSFDNIYFTYSNNEYPAVNYVYTICAEDIKSYRSDKVMNIALDRKWRLLIDKNN
jgi:hypothetical protein